MWKVTYQGPGSITATLPYVSGRIFSLPLSLCSNIRQYILDRVFRERNSSVTQGIVAEYSHLIPVRCFMQPGRQTAVRYRNRSEGFIKARPATQIAKGLPFPFCGDLGRRPINEYNKHIWYKDVKSLAQVWLWQSGLRQFENGPSIESKFKRLRIFDSILICHIFYFT